MLGTATGSHKPDANRGQKRKPYLAALRRGHRARASNQGHAAGRYAGAVWV
jgi:hypothetical protein